MLVTFRTKAYADITMFGDVAVALLKLMGQSGTVPGALMPEDIPPALARLKSAVEEHAQEPLDPAPSGTQTATPDGKEGRFVSLAHRALPLIELLAAAAADDAYVMWD